MGSQSGDVILQSHNWSEFLGTHFTKIPAIKSHHHFYFDSSSPGEVTVKASADSDQVTYKLNKDDNWSPTTSVLPLPIVPNGLSLERKMYLYHKIRDNCSIEMKDIVCPFPGPGIPPSSPSTHHPSPLTAMPPPPPPSTPSKRKRCCKVCGEQGHNSQTCKKQRN